VQTLILILCHIAIVRLVVHELNKLNIGDRTHFVEVLINLSKNRADMYHIECIITRSKPSHLECVEINLWIFNTFSKQN